MEVGATDAYSTFEHAVRGTQIASLVVAVGLLVYEVLLGHTVFSVQLRSE